MPKRDGWDDWTEKRWANNPASYEDVYNHSRGQSTIRSPRPERDRWESDSRYADTEAEYARLQSLRPSRTASPIGSFGRPAYGGSTAPAWEVIEAEHQRLAPLRPARERSPRLYGEDSRDPLMPDRGESKKSYLGRAPYGSKGVYEERWRRHEDLQRRSAALATPPPQHEDRYSPSYSSDRYYDQRGPRTNPGPRLTPYLGESKMAYINRMDRDRQPLAGAEERWEELEGRWRPFIGESHSEYIDRIGQSNIPGRPSLEESRRRWDTIEGPLQPLRCEDLNAYCKRLAAKGLRQTAGDSERRWEALEGRFWPQSWETVNVYLLRMQREYGGSVTQREAEDRWEAFGKRKDGERGY